MEMLYFIKIHFVVVSLGETCSRRELPHYVGKLHLKFLKELHKLQREQN